MTFPAFHEDAHLYFITASIVGWKPLFLFPQYATIVLDSLSWMRAQGYIKLFAFVLLPTHLHWIAKPLNQQISPILQQFGSFTAHQILKQLEQDHEVALLNFLQTQKRDRRRLHSIWQDIQAKNIFSDEALNQAMEYLHANPISKKWALVDDRADYCYSTAGYYDRNEPPPIEIDDARDWLSAPLD